MNVDIKTLFVNWVPVVLVLVIFMGILWGIKKLFAQSAEVAAGLQKSAVRGDELSLEVVKNARILSHQYLFSLSSIAVWSLLLHTISFPIWKAYRGEETATDLMTILVFVIGSFSVAQQASRVKKIAKQFGFPLVNLRNYVVSLVVGIIWVCISLRYSATADATLYALRILIAILVSTQLFEIFCQKWVLSAYSGSGNVSEQTEDE
jgi:hypothetical protein